MPPRASETLIVSERLLLRPPVRADFEAWQRLRADSRDTLEPREPLWPTDALSRADWNRRLTAWHRAWRDGSAFVFLIRRQRDDVLMGGISLTHVRPWPVDSASLGYWMGAAFEGHGYMREAVGAVTRWAFSALALWRIEAGIVPDNARSRRVLEASGFREEGYAVGYLEIAGERCDHVLFGLVRPRQES